ncbi:TraB domain-containing protein [Thermococcus celer]|uniref:Conjugal transfer protein TraB n=1 Tax=Thermococcus celer Vu 13 = JCM 8558 TaxID=1293037 RepID=A0A218NZT3_THECE|nr:TraB/GumN family protein [Thermococcus celer]ASI98155.1 conjugal transfer protein TraB [Thermococcus celer Vu 13 = JCM 8558]
MSYLRYVRLIGTMHVSPQSREEVIRTILSERPHAVAVELDRARFLAMGEERRLSLEESLRFGRRGLVNYVLAKVEEKLGEEFGMKPGEEMKAAISAAQLLGVPLYLIDEDIGVVLSKILAAPGREKLLMALEALSVFLPVKSGQFSDPMEDYRVMMLQFKRRYPYLYRVLVEERNEIMARNLISIVDELRRRGIRKPRVIAVVGLGHRPGIEHILNNVKLR